MGGEDDLHIGVQIEYQVDEPFLPLHVQTHLRLVHEEHIGLAVLYEHGEQYDEHLLLTARQLVGHQHLSNLRESYLVLRADYLFPRLGEKVIDQVLKFLFGLAELLRLSGSLGGAFLQGLNHAVADIHLIVEVLSLELVDLPIQLRDESGVYPTRNLAAHQRPVERADDVEADPLGLLRLDAEMDPLEQMARKLTTVGETAHHFVQDGALAYPIDAAENVDPAVQLPADVLLSAPQ